MLQLDNAVGNQEDWANYITNVETRDTPIMSWLPVGTKPVNPEYKYQVDKWRDPRQNSHVDGEPWKEFKTAGENREELTSYIQWLDNTFSVSKLAQDVANNAAITDEIARETPIALKEMATDAEAAFGSDNDSREDNKVQGYLTRGMGEWIKATAQAHAPVPAGFRTPAAAIDTTATASVDEDDIRNVLQEMHVQSKSAEDMDGFVGIGLKRRFADFPNYLPSSNSTQASGIVHEAMYNKEIMRQVDVYKTDAGTLRLHPHFWLAAFNPSAVVQQNRGYFLHRSRWELRWNQKPKVYRPEFKGGSYEVALDMILMLCAKNVRAEGKIAPTA